MELTAVSLSNGRTLNVRSTYDSLKSYFARRTMSQDDGFREVILADGRRTTLQVAAVLGFEEAATFTKQAVGFR